MTPGDGLPSKPGLGPQPEGEEAHPRPRGRRGPGTTKVEQAQIERDKAVALAKIEADKAVALAKIQADDDPPLAPVPEPPSKTIKAIGIAGVGILMAIAAILSVLYNVPFHGNPLTGDVTIGQQPTTQSADPGVKP